MLRGGGAVESDEEQSESDSDDGRAVAVKEDPQFTLAVTRGASTSEKCCFMSFR